VLAEAVGREPSLTGVNFTIVGGPEVIGWPPLVEYAAGLASVGVPVFLSARGTLGYLLDMMRLNDRLMSAALSRDTQRLRRELNSCSACCCIGPSGLSSGRRRSDSVDAEHLLLPGAEPGQFYRPGGGGSIPVRKPEPASAG
jgi:hypothetical protein